MTRTEKMLLATILREVEDAERILHGAASSYVFMLWEICMIYTSLVLILTKCIRRQTCVLDPERRHHTISTQCLRAFAMNSDINPTVPEGHLCPSLGPDAANFVITACVLNPGKEGRKQGDRNCNDDILGYPVSSSDIVHSTSPSVFVPLLWINSQEDR